MQKHVKKKGGQINEKKIFHGKILKVILHNEFGYEFKLDRQFKMPVYSLEYYCTMQTLLIQTTVYYNNNHNN